MRQIVAANIQSHDIEREPEVYLKDVRVDSLEMNLTLAVIVFGEKNAIGKPFFS